MAMNVFNDFDMAADFLPIQIAETMMLLIKASTLELSNCKALMDVTDLKPML